MVVPLAGRWVAAAAGVALVLTAWTSVIGTLIVPRPVSSWLTRWVDRSVNWVFRLVTGAITDHRRRDQVLASQAPAILLTQLIAWLGIFFLGYMLLLWPFEHRRHSVGLHRRRLGHVHPRVRGAARPAPAAIVFVAAATGLVIVALQIAYLPVLYAAFNRRETEVALLNARAGVPSWGPELLARTHYAPGVGRLDHRYAARSVRPVGTLGRRRDGEPHHLPAAGAVPLTPAAVILGDRAAGRAGFRRADPDAVPRLARRSCRPGCACAAGSCASGRSPGRWASTSPTSPTRTARSR